MGTVQAALTAASARLAAAGVADPVRDARLLMAEALGTVAVKRSKASRLMPCRRITRMRSASLGSRVTAMPPSPVVMVLLA